LSLSLHKKYFNFILCSVVPVLHVGRADILHLHNFALRRSIFRGCWWWLVLVVAGAGGGWWWLVVAGAGGGWCWWWLVLVVAGAGGGWCWWWLVYYDDIWRIIPILRCV
jgi:hypothetical protein